MICNILILYIALLSGLATEPYWLSLLLVCDGITNFSLLRFELESPWTCLCPPNVHNPSKLILFQDSQGYY